MQNGVTKITRGELYEQVWSVPMSRLSVRYGLSDVGLAKICRKHRIPRPTRGYWARKEAGESLRRTPLPPVDPDTVIEIRSNTYSATNAELKEATQSSAAIEKLPEKQIVVSDTLRSPHPLVGLSLETLESLEPDSHGLLNPPGKDCLDVTVSKKSLRRALRIMDALIKALEERGHQVSLSGDATCAGVMEVSLRFGISELLVTKRKEPKDHNLEGYYQFGHSRFYDERAPSGNLCLTIHNRAPYWITSCRRNWKDRESKPIEGQLNSFVIGLAKVAALTKEHIRQKEEEERKRREQERILEEQRRIRAEKLRRKKEESEKVSKLITDAENWYKSRLIRQYISAIEAFSASGDCAFRPDEGWLKWARNQAARLDPLSSSPPSILDEEIEEERPQDRNGFLYRKPSW